MQRLNSFTKEELDRLTFKRKGETKLGEKVNVYEPERRSKLEEQKKKGARFAVLGIPESIGVLGNYGASGTEKSYQAFLKFFLNIQI